MSVEESAKGLLHKKFEAKRINSILNHFLSVIRKFEEGDWESSLNKSGKFIEAIIKKIKEKSWGRNCYAKSDNRVI